MAAWVGASKAADDVRHFGMGRDDAVRQAFLLQEGGDKSSGVASVAGGIGAGVAYEGLQEVHEIAAVAIDPIEQLLTPRVHLDLPRSLPNCASAAARRSRPSLRPDGTAERGLVPLPAIADAGGPGNIWHSRKTAKRRPLPAADQEPERQWQGCGCDHDSIT